MAKIYCKSSYLLRRDTAANWNTKNPILREGEEGYETDTGRRKVGNGTTEWNNLKYDSGIVDQTYTPESENAQSGLAVAEAVAPKADKKTVEELKSDLSYLVNAEQPISIYGNFQHYGLNPNGTFKTEQKYRVSNDNPITFDRDVLFTVANGFRWGYIPFVSGTAGSWSEWKTTPFLVPKGTSFVIQIARINEVSSEIANVIEFTNALKIDSEYVNYMNERQYVLDAINGKDNLLNHGKFIHGSLDYGAFQYRMYRICSENIIHFEHQTTLTIKNGYRIVHEYYQNGAWKESKGWSTGTVVIPKGSYVKFVIAKTTETTSVPADLHEFVSAVEFTSSTYKRLDVIEKKIQQTDYVETPWEQEIHRGIITTTIPENTIPSFLEVAKNGFKQFECDVRKTSDGILVMSHDAEFNGYVVSETDYETLNSVVISTDSEYGEIHIAKFEDALKVAYFNGLTIHIDIKDSSIINDVVNMTVANGMSGRAIYNPNTGETTVGLGIMGIDKRATVVYPYNKGNIENYFSQAFPDKSKIIIVIPFYNVTDEAMSVIRASGFKSLIYDVLNSTWFEKRPDIIEYRTATASTINELNKIYMDSITY